VKNDYRNTNINSIFVLGTEPFAGLWLGNTDRGGFNHQQRWRLHDGKICWEPLGPANTQYWEQRIHMLVEETTERRQQAAFLRLSKTSQTRATWSLPALAACPKRDETCEHCYAQQGWYRVDLPRQVDRVLRLEYLQGLIRKNSLSTWVQWMANTLNALPPDEPFPAALGHFHGFNSETKIPYFRWHDSGDLFNKEYARAVFQVCEMTPRVAHWLPTRMAGLVQSLVQKGVTIPLNLSVQVSVHRGGMLEAVQVHSVRDVLQAQPSARIGLSYFVNGTTNRKADLQLVEGHFGKGAVVCPAITATNPKERVCNGCRRRWASTFESPVIFPKIK